MLKMKELLYPLNALEPYYSKETLDLHYNILYKGYVDNTNNTEEKLRVAREKADFTNIKCLEKDLSFFGSGVILHELFFDNMGPAIPTEPDIELMKQIIKTLVVMKFLNNNLQKQVKLKEFVLLLI